MTSAWIDLSHNVNPHPASACLAVAHSLTAADLYDYSPSFRKGRSDLIDRLAEDCKVDPERVALGYGDEDLLKQSLRYFVQPGDRVAVPAPTWRYYREAIEEVGGVAVGYPVIAARDRYTVDVDALLELRERHPVRMLLLASPSNPTGDLFPAHRLDEVLHAYRDAVVRLDEAYYGLDDVAPDPALLPALTRRHPHLMVGRTFSKRYALAGLRCGYDVLGAELAGFGRAMTRYLGYSHPAERIVLAALDSTTHYELVRQEIVEDRERLYRAVAPFPTAVAYRSQANFVLIRFAPRAAVAVRAALDAAGFIVKWFTDEPGLEYCARITLGTAVQNATVRTALTQALASVGHRKMRKADYLPAYALTGDR